jgi:hypothetical protein
VLSFDGRKAAAVAGSRPFAMISRRIECLDSLDGRIGPREDRRVWLERLAFALSGRCPFDGTNPVECPLHGLRYLGEMDRLDWLNCLTDDELEYLAAYHLCCISEKIRRLEIAAEEARRAARLEEPVE